MSARQRRLSASQPPSSQVPLSPFRPHRPLVSRRPAAVVVGTLATAALALQPLLASPAGASGASPSPSPTGTRVYRDQVSESDRATRQSRRACVSLNCGGPLGQMVSCEWLTPRAWVHDGQRETIHSFDSIINARTGFPVLCASTWAAPAGCRFFGLSTTSTPCAHRL